MNKKKIVKPIIAAAAAAAIAGISAVSFAAWTAGTDNTKDVANNTLGTVSVLKFDTTVSNAVTGLLPIDQNTNAYEATNNPLYGVIEFDIDDYDYSNFTLKVEFTTDDTYDSATKFYVGTTATSATSKGTELDMDNGTTLTYSIKAEGVTDHYKLYICHDSAALGDMGNTFKLTLTLSEGSNS